MKQRLAALVQLAIGAGILAFIFWNLKRTGQIHNLLVAWRDTADHGVLLTLGFAGLGLCLLICTLRWHLILRAQGFPLTFARCAMLYLIGQFFNAFMLGATGGDLVKAWYVAQETPNRKTEIIASVFLDRLVGLLAIMVLAPLAMLLRFPLFWARPETRLMLILMVALLAGAMVGMIVLFRRNLFAHWAWLDRITRHHPVGCMARRVYDAFQMALNHPGLLTRAVIISVMNHLIFVGTTIAYGRAAGLSIGPVDYFAAFLAINLIAAIPITPSGIGTRETAALMLLGALGVASGQAVLLSLMLFGTILGWSLIGGVVYAVFIARGAGRPSTAPSGLPIS